MDISISCNTILSCQFTGKDDVEFKKTCYLISQDVKDGKFEVVELVKQLQNLLVNPSPTQRELGVLILTEVLTNLPVDFLSDQQLETILLFYTNKLSDHHQVLPAVLQGFVALIKFKNFPGKVVPNILNTIFQNIACQQQQQTERRNIYTIFQVLLENYKTEVLSMGLDFVYGIISSIDGERDPRNLLFLFKWLKTFLTTISLGHLVEEMFEVVACYFPIDFRTPVNSNNVSRDALADALCPCLCAIPEFAEYCIPLALEKLDSSLEVAKTDSLSLLEEGCNTFDTSSYVKYGSDIWSQIQKEVFSGVNDNVKLKCLRTLTVIMSKMSGTTNGYFNSILNDISMTVKGNLLPDSKLFGPSSDILLHTALASQDSAAYIIKDILPLLTNTYSITTSSDKKAVLVRTMTQFVKVYLTQHNIVNLNEIEELQPIPVLSLKAVIHTDNSLKIAGFNSLSELADKLPLDVRLTLYETLCTALIEPQEENIRMSILECFTKLSSLYQDEIKDHILNRSKINNSFALDLYLSALIAIINLNYFTDMLIDIMLTYVIQNDVPFGVVALKNIKKMLESESRESVLIKIFFEKGTVKKLVDYALMLNVSNNLNFELLKYISSILKILIGSQNYEVQSEVIGYQLNVISSCTNKSEEVYVFLLDGLLSRLRKILLVEAMVSDFLIKISLLYKEDAVRDVAVQLLANLINKHFNEIELNTWLAVILEDYLNSNVYAENTTNKIVAVSWITKALIMRNHFQANSWINLMLNMFEHNNECSKGFRIVMNDNCESLSLNSYCNISLLYKQKFFVFVMGKLSTNYEPGKTSYLRATGYLLEFAPEQVILLQFKKILNLVVQCLEHCNDGEILCIILNRLKSFIIKNEPVIQENLEDLILRILDLTTFEQSMKVRITALQCLHSYTKSLALYRILPFKQKVLHQLGLCIDDKKRLVRKEAMDARSAWYLIDAPM